MCRGGANTTKELGIKEMLKLLDNSKPNDLECDISTAKQCLYSKPCTVNVYESIILIDLTGLSL